MPERPSRLRKHERPHGVNPHIKEYAGRLGTPPLFTMKDGRPVHLADPPERGYRTGERPIQEIGGVPIRMSITDGVPVVGDLAPYDLAETMEEIDNGDDRRTDGVGFPD